MRIRGGFWILTFVFVVIFTIWSLLYITRFVDVDSQVKTHLGLRTGLQGCPELFQWNEGTTSMFSRDYRTVKESIILSKGFPWKFFQNESLFYPLWHKLHEQIQSDVEGKQLGDIFHPLPQYRNPCWREKPDGELSCLPHLFLPGVAKSGSTDLFDCLHQHPHIVRSKIKEPTYWYMKGRNTSYWKKELRFYVDNFSPIAKAIQNTTTEDPAQWLVTADGCPQTLYKFPYWRSIPGNRGLTEPKYIAPLMIMALQPKAKFIIILRNPVDRAYSHYKHFQRVKPHSPDDFHNLAMNLLCQFGLYHVFIKDWLDIIPREQLLFIKAEDYYQDRWLSLQNVTSFLGLDPFHDSLRSKFKTNMAANAGKESEAMLPVTRSALERFFKPHNAQLRRIIKDDRFIWH